MNIIDRIKEYIDFKGISKYRFYQDTGFSNGFLDKNSNIGSDKCEKIIYQYADVNPEWLLTGRGSMLRDSTNVEETKWSSTPIATPISPAEESVIYKMYEKKDEESRALIRENGRLEERLRSMEQELGALKSKHEPHPEPLKRAPKSSDPAKPAFTKQPSSPNADNVTSAIVP